MEKLLTAALGQGLYAGMFVFLLLWVLKKNDEREKNYQALIEKQTKTLGEVARTLGEVVPKNRHPHLRLKHRRTDAEHIRPETNLT